MRRRSAPLRAVLPMLNSPPARTRRVSRVLTIAHRSWSDHSLDVFRGVEAVRRPRRYYSFWWAVTANEYNQQCAVLLQFCWLRLVRFAVARLNPPVSFIDLIEHIECFADRCANRIASIDELSLVADVLVEVIKQFLGNLDADLRHTADVRRGICSAYRTADRTRSQFSVCMADNELMGTTPTLPATAIASHILPPRSRPSEIVSPPCRIPALGSLFRNLGHYLLTGWEIRLWVIERIPCLSVEQVKPRRVVRNRHRLTGADFCSWLCLYVTRCGSDRTV